MFLIGLLRTRQRSMAKQWKQRRLPRRSAMPPIGTSVVNAPENLRLVVQRGMRAELWRWLMDQGWRVETYRPDRRKYQELPSLWVAALIDAEPAFRVQVMARAVLSARSEATVAARPATIAARAGLLRERAV